MVQDQKQVCPKVIARRKADIKAHASHRRHLAIVNTMDPADWQESHAPTESVKVRIVNRVQVVNGISSRVTITHEQCRRRKQDARIWDALSPAHERAAEAIVAGWRILSHKLGGGIMRYDPPTAKSAEGDNEAADQWRHRIISRYIEWGRACHAQGINRSAIMQILANGHGLRAVDRGNRRENGWSKDMLTRGLDLYCDLHKIW